MKNKSIPRYESSREILTVIKGDNYEKTFELTLSSGGIGILTYLFNPSMGKSIDWDIIEFEEGS